MIRIIFFACSICITLGANAQNYSPFNPVPKDQMRSFSIDRPAVTESPISVDAGHFQFEGDIYRWSKAFQTDGPRLINVWNGLYKMGLTNRIDIQVGVELYNVYQDQNGEKVESGYGNTTLRLKYNFWGNDGGTTALGMIPHITFPTSAVDEDISYGVSFPLGFTISSKFDGGAQFQFDFVPDGAGHDLTYLQTIQILGQVAGPVDFFLEVMGVFSEGISFYSLNGGLLYNLSPNAIIDINTNLGLVKEAPTRAFVGLSFRL